MQKANITFTEETYNILKQVAETGKVDEDYDCFIGYITQGAVCCGLTLLKDEGFAEDDYCFGGAFVIDAKYFLLGKDTGYGEIKDVPYDCPMGFYGYLKDTYEETKNSLLALFDECMREDAELVEGAKNETLTWDKVRSEEYVP